MNEALQNPYDDEIDLREIINVLWKHKLLILFGTLCVTLVAAGISLMMPKIYRVGMVLKPTVLRIDESGKDVYIETAQNIASILKLGSYNDKIINKFNENNKNNEIYNIKYQVSLPKDTVTVKVEIDGEDVSKNKKILQLLKEFILKEYEQKVLFHQTKHQYSISKLINQINYQTELIKSRHSNIKILEESINRIMGEVEKINWNTEFLGSAWEKFIEQGVKPDNMMISMLYSNTTLGLYNNFKDQINGYQLRKEAEITALEQTETKLADLQQQINLVELIKNNIRNIQVIQEPTSDNNPVKPKKTMIVAAAFFGGLFAMVILVFFMEMMRQVPKIDNITESHKKV